jgi:predicted DNA binding CopG/RHH family protein
MSDEKTVIKRWADVPAFDSEKEEAEFWAQTTLEQRLMNGSVLKNDARESATITLRFDPRMLARIKRVARSRFLNYQSMIKVWLAERLEKEVQ